MDPTYELISQQVLTSNQSSISFTNIPQSYRDLCILASSRGATTGFGLRFNNDSGSNYSWRRIYGNGTGVFNDTNATYGGVYNTWFYTMQSQNSYTSSTFGNTEVYIPNYRSNTNKSISSTAVGENNASSSVLGALSGLWSNTSPINSITVVCDGGDFVTGSSFQLYGIKNADDGGRGFFGPAMTGGNEVYTTGNGYKVHVFKNSGTLNVTAPGEIEYLVIAGGGGGGASFAGGGGAGGYRSSVAGESSGGGTITESKKLISPGSYSVIVGAGGTGGSTLNVSPYTNTVATAGNQSSFIDIVSVGGGRSPYVQYADNPEQAAGGSGAGGNGASNSTRRGGYGVSGQGTNGGNGIDGGISTTFTGGGGGAGTSGGNAVGSVSGNGGNGLASSITGTSITRAGGGGGGLGNTGTPGTGGSGGGGNASASSAAAAGSGTINTGSGGGGGSYFGNLHGSGGNGGSGIVIIRYRI